MGVVIGRLRGSAAESVPEDIESVDRAMSYLVDQPEEMESSKITYEAVRIVVLHLRKQGLANVNTEGELYINRVILSLFCTGKLKPFLNKIFKHWLDVNTKINKKSTFLVKVSDINYMNILAQLLLLMSQHRTLFTLETLTNFKYELITATLITKHNIPPKSNSDVYPVQNFIELLTKEECKTAYLIFKDTLNNFLNLKTSFITRSYVTVDAVSYLAKHSFVIMVRIFFHIQHYRFMREDVLKQYSEQAVKIGAYFLATAVEERALGLYNLSVKFLTYLLYDGQTNKNIVGFPSHMFLKAPITSQNSIYHFILCNLFSGISRKIAEVEEGTLKTIKVTNHMNINRFDSWRLILYLLENEQAKLDQGTCHQIEELCKTVKITDIERIYVCKMIKAALRVCPSEILNKFARTQKIEYQLNFSNQSITFTSSQILAHLQNYLEFIPSNIPRENQRYLYESFFNNIVQPHWCETELWNLLKFRLNDPSNRLSVSKRQVESAECFHTQTTIMDKQQRIQTKHNFEKIVQKI